MYSYSNFHQRISKAFKVFSRTNSHYVIEHYLFWECLQIWFISFQFHLLWILFLLFTIQFNNLSPFQVLLPPHTTVHIILYFRLVKCFLLDTSLKYLFISRWSSQSEIPICFPNDANVAQGSRNKAHTPTRHRFVVVIKS